MQSKASTPAEYIDSLPPERKQVLSEMRKQVLKNLPKGFKEVMSYGMLGYVVPHNLYPEGYHCDPKQPLPFMGLASQKNFIALYHMGIYGDKNLLKWFTDEYGKQCTSKLDMGKGCIRFKKMDDIPYKLIGELATKVTPKEWVNKYVMARMDYAQKKDQEKSQISKLPSERLPD
jgi:uncharacterized protein YdhG (YjbR/CyaY superfamily)